MMCNFSSKLQLLSSASISLRRVTRRFAGGVAALEDVSFDIAPGKITAIIGASGSGKTTLLRLIAGLDQPTSGSINFSGAPRLAYVFQQPALLPWASVAENVSLPARLQNTVIIDAALHLAQVGLSDKSAAAPHELSGGQQMRVSIARALASQPSLMLLDEPFAALDEITRQKLSDLVVELAQQLSITMVFVTHNISEAVYVADEIVLLQSHPGKVAAQVQVQAPLPRQPDFRASPAYGAQCAALSAQLAAVMA
jgi:NitT/TauT family transport system ATP-binding protein